MTDARRGDSRHSHLAATTAASTTTLGRLAVRDRDGLAWLRWFRWLARLGWSLWDVDRTGADVTDFDGTPLVATRVDLVDDDDAAVGT